MATFYGENATKILNTNPPQMAGIGDMGGRMRVLYDKFTFSAVLTTTDKLYMGGKLPKGARIIECYVKSSDLGSTGDVNIGWEASEELSNGTTVEAADPDGFFAALDVNAAALKTSMIASSFGNIASLMKKLAGAVQPVIVPTEDTTATSGSLEVAIVYVID